MDDRKSYSSVLAERYASREISYLFSPHHKILTWRKLWIALAKAQKKLGLPITEEQIKDLTKAVENIDFHAAEKYEKTFRHDVMAHIHAFGDASPSAKGIIHLGATSCYVTDNADLLAIREALLLLSKKMAQLIYHLKEFAEKHAALPCLAYTHFQPAQPTTVGKRACLWTQDFLEDLRHFESTLQQIRFLGVKGATGTQASFLTLFHGDAQKVKQMETLVAEEMGFSRFFPSRDRPTRENKTSKSSHASQALQPLRTSAQPISDCLPTSKR